jgi:hypothetical protein
MTAIEFQADRVYVSAHGKLVAHVAFILLFPGFFFYQTLLGVGIIRAYLGGYFSAIAFLFLLPLAWHYFLAVKKNRDYFQKTDFYFILFAIYYCIVLLANFAAGANASIVQRYAATLIFCIDVYIIFRMIDLTNKQFMLAATGSLLLMSAITFYFSIDGFFYLRSLDEASNPESLATYQGFARSYIFTFLVVVATVKAVGGRLLLYALAIISLFLNGARSEFSAVLFIVPIIELYYAKHKLYSVAFAFFLSVWLGTNADSLLGMLPETRILQLFDLSHSSSGAAREQLSIDAWRTITNNPIFGDFASYPDGHYAHNILCGWVDFGLIGVLFFAALLVFPAVALFANGYFARTKSGDFILACSFSCIAILWALTAKAVPDMSIGAALGAFAKYRYATRYRQTS